MEKHLLANHLFKNIKALIFAGLFFQGPDACRWLEKGLKMLKRELREQVLSDGGHFERSPMYHSMILEDCLDLINVGRHSSADMKGLDELSNIASSMISFLTGVTHPDGKIALFNDAAFCVEPEPDDLCGYYDRVIGGRILGKESATSSFPDTGYYVMSPREGDKLIVDCGAIGPDYQPGHSHCDTLSFELSLKGNRIIVDSGCSQYEDGEIRRYNRGNVGHNTLTVDAENQSEVWGAHRCARRARPLYAELRANMDGSLVFKGAHDGYKRLPGKPIHHRSFVWSQDSLCVDDHVTGEGRHDIELRIHIHPDFKVEVHGQDSIVVKDNDKEIAHISPLGHHGYEVSRGWYCPEFGLQKTCTVIACTAHNAALPFEGGWLVKADN